MQAYAFLGAGGTSFLTGLRWPAPGVWFERDDDAVRACDQGQLSWWLDDELWEVELAGEIRELGRALVASKARLVGRVEGWTDATAMELVVACAHRVRDRAVDALVAEGRGPEAEELAAADELDAIERVASRLAVGDSRTGDVLAGLAADVVLYAQDAGDAPRAAGVAAYVAAFALAGGDKRSPGYQESFEAERRRQAEWLKQRLQL